MKAMRLILFGVVAFMVSCMDSEDPNKALNDEIKQIDQYLQTMGKADEALYDNVNGYRLVISDYGQYPPPHNGQTVKVHYEGRLFPSGNFFDSDVKVSKLEDLTPQALRYIASNVLGGSTATIFVPSKFGYGAEGSAALGVPANSILMYDIYLAEVNRTALEQSRFVTDSTAIANYLEENTIDATYHPAGIWYTVTEQGTGPFPNPYTLLDFDYKLRLLSSTSTLQESNIARQPAMGLVDGLKVGLPLLREGGKATFYIPSLLGYGTSATQSIPANSNLVFEISLTNIGN